MAGPVPSEAHEKDTKQGEGQDHAEKSVAQEKVDQYAKQAHDKVVKAGTPTDNHDKAEQTDKGPDLSAKSEDGTAVVAESKPSPWLEYSALPARPAFGTVAKAGITAAAILNPVATGVVAGGVALHLKAWNFLKTRRPFSWIERGRVAAWDGVKSGVKSSWETATYLPKLAGTVVLNTGKGIVRGVIETSGWAWEKFTDIFEDTPGEAKHILEKIFDKVKETTGMALDVVIGAPKWYLEHLLKQPIRTIIGSMVVIGAVNGPGIVALSKHVVELVVKILEKFAI